MKGTNLKCTFTEFYNSNSYQNLEHFYHPRKLCMPLPHQSSHSHYNSHYSDSFPHHRFILLIVVLHINGIIRMYFLMYVWLFTQHNDFEIHPCLFVICSFLLLTNIPLYTQYVFTFSYGHPGCSQKLAIVNKVSMNILVQVFFEAFLNKTCSSLRMDMFHLS